MKPDYHLVRITRSAKDKLEKFLERKNVGTTRVNASHFISDALVEKIQKEQAK